MQDLWWKILEMGLAAGWLVLAILALRLVCRRFLPHNIRCVLWILVAVRLICPVMPESGFSLMPREGEHVAADRGASHLEEESGAWPGETVGAEQEIQLTEKENSGAQVLSDVQRDGEQVTGLFFSPGGIKTYLGRPGQNIFVALTEWMRQYLPGWLWIVWLAGTALMAGYGLYGYLHMRYLVRDAIPESEENGRVCSWRSDRIRSPFVLGIFSPRIYLPCGAPEETREYVLAHEQAHISRRDPLVKLAGYALLTVYWFQPLVWIAYGLLCRDIELACDERVIRSYGEDTCRKRSYMEALLALSVQETVHKGGVLAFGEGGVRRRVGNLLHYKRPAVWMVGISVLLCVAAAVCLLTNPRQRDIPEKSTSGQQRDSESEGSDQPDQQISAEADISGSSQMDQNDVQDILEPDGTNLMALPMGQRVRVDLDGDGEEEILLITVSIDNEMAQLNGGDWRFAKPAIQVGEQSYVPEVFFDSLDLCTWYLFRIGGTAEGYQIGLYEDGPSADPDTHLFAWQKAGETGRLVYLGRFPANVIYDTYPGYCWERGGQEPVGHDGRSYREVLEQVDRSINSWMRVPGDGSIYTCQYMDIVQSEQMMVQWKLGGIRYNSLELQEQSRYEFWNVDDPYADGYAYCTKEELYVYTEPDRQAETAVIPVGENVAFLFYDAESGWIELGYSQGEKTGYILADAPYSSILLAPGPAGGTEPISKRPADIFEGLHATD
ncbi:MAG: M56 family metallopeptidase [Lachnospiraceae bacterium]|nr:M56 family metallopeptidase [Lachnospiraceae bacterium]